jgi:hypothetical protein
LSDYVIGDKRAVALAKALEVNSTITTIKLVFNLSLRPSVHILTCVLTALFSLSRNGFPAQGAMALAEALKVNRTITTIE